MKKIVFISILFWSFDALTFPIPTKYDGGRSTYNTSGEGADFAEVMGYLYPDTLHDGIVRAYTSKDKEVRHAKRKYVASLIWGPGAPIGWTVGVVCDVQSGIKAGWYNRELGKGTAEVPMRNVRHQRRGHLFTVIKQRDLQALSMLLAVVGYQRRLDMYQGSHTPISKAALDGWNEGLRLMLENGGNPNPVVKWWTNRPSLVEELMQREGCNEGLRTVLGKTKTVSEKELTLAFSLRNGGVFNAIADYCPGYEYNAGTNTLSSQVIAPGEMQERDPYGEE